MIKAASKIINALRLGVLSLIACGFILLVIGLVVKDVMTPEAIKPVQPLPLPQPTEYQPQPDTCVMIEGIRVCSEKTINTPEPLANNNTQLTRSFSPIHPLLDGNIQHVCALHGKPHFSGVSNIREAKPEVKKALQWMTTQVGISNNFEIFAADFEKSWIAFAAIRKNQRYIVYDAAKQFTTPDNTLSWTSLGVLAHELGHHLAGHTAAKNQANHDRELEADQFAGFILSKLGANEQQATEWTDILNKNDTPSHPAKTKRLHAAMTGWQQAKNLNLHKNNQCQHRWLGEALTKDQKTCRWVQYCEIGMTKKVLACQNDVGEWKWRK